MADDGNDVSSEGLKKGHVGVDSDFPEMTAKIDDLKGGNAGLELEKSRIRERMDSLTVELQELRNDKAAMQERLDDLHQKVEQSESDARAIEATASRAIDLERLQHDLIASRSAGEDANAEVLKLKGHLEEAAQVLEKFMEEKAGFLREMDELKSELEALVFRVKNEGINRARVEEEVNTHARRMEVEISERKKRIGEMEAEVARNEMELEKIAMVKNTEIRWRNDAEEAAKTEDDKVAALESLLSNLTEELDESQRLISELEEKVMNGVEGLEGFGKGEDKRSGCLGLQLPAVTVAALTVFAMAIAACLRYTKGR